MFAVVVDCVESIYLPPLVTHTYEFSLIRLCGTVIMGSFIGDKANEAVEAKVFQEGGYMGLWKYRAVRLYKKCSCC
eukprot:scaffold30781_cov52-Attheya_sp.AAC.5